MVGGRVHEPPYEGVLGLLDWAKELWPYVNGKALMSGVRLLELDSVDMLDIVHYFFEEDNTYSTPEGVESRSKLRTLLYGKLYNKEYKFPYTSSETGYNYSTDIGEPELAPPGNSSDTEDAPPKPDKGPTKPFVPTTDSNSDSPLPFGKLVDPPAENWGRW